MKLHGLRRYLHTVGVLCRTLTKRLVRDPVALFFIFLFPLLFLVIFGFIFRDGDVSFDVAVINRSNSQFAIDFTKQIKEDKIFKVKDVTSLDDAKDKMGKGELNSIIELPENFGAPDAAGVPRGQAVVYYEASNPQTGQTVGGIMQQVLEGINAQLTQVTAPLTVEQKPTETSSLTRFDYTFAGIVGFSMLSLGIFGMANGFPADKKTGSLRRLRATPLTALQLVLATALEFLMIGILSVAAMLAIAVLLFDFQLRGNILIFGSYILIGIFCLFGFGLAIGGWAKNENQAAPLAQLVVLPMMFLSGVFFPVYLMPEWLQNISQYLPLTPIIEGIRLITTEHATLLELGPELLIIGGWTVVIYFIATRVFRWE